MLKVKHIRRTEHRFGVFEVEFHMIRVEGLQKDSSLIQIGLEHRLEFYDNLYDDNMLDRTFVKMKDGYYLSGYVNSQIALLGLRRLMCGLQCRVQEILATEIGTIH